MKINLLTHLNGLGLERDAHIIEAVLKDAGHDVMITCLKKGGNLGKYDINIHLELIGERYMGRANKNIFIPNPEWCSNTWERMMAKFNVIFVKTKDAEKIFKNINNTVYTSFTSPDRYIKGCTKIDDYMLHVSGKSETKNTKLLINAYQKYSTVLPKLIIVSTKEYNTAPGIIYQKRRMYDDDLKALQNTCLVSVCPSQYEGWGHYIHESMSTESVVITTDGAPMNEFIQDGENGFLIKSKSSGKQHYGVLQSFDAIDFVNVIEKIKKTSEQKLLTIGKNARKSFLKNDKYFKSKIIEEINKL